MIVETENVAADLSLWIGGRYFVEYPDKVLGMPTEVTTRFGMGIIIKGDIENVENGIEVDPVTAYPYVLATPDGENILEADSDMIDMAIAKSMNAQEAPATASLEMVGFDEMRRRFNSEASDEEYRVWLHYQRGRLYDSLVVQNPLNAWSRYLVPDDQLEETIRIWVEQDLMAYDGHEYIPSVVYYAGNIYDKIQELQSSEAAITEVIGQNGYSRQLSRLQSSRPEMLRILAPENERLFISPLDPFAKEVFVTKFQDGTIMEDGTTLLYGFYHWLQETLPADYTHGSGRHDVWSVYILGEAIRGKDIDPAVKVARKRNAQMDGLALFARYLYDAVSREDQIKIEYLWNSRYNNWQEFDFKKIPVGFEINKWFKTGPIDPRPALWEGVKFMGANGSGLIAFDVGVGKTMTAILAIAQAMYTGQCKRPLIVVPNPTYKKWISETVGEWNDDGTCRVQGVLPQYKDRVNDYYNLGVESYNKAVLSPPQDYSITFVTYEGLQKMGFSKNVTNELSGQFFNILNQGGLKERDAAKLVEKIDGLMGTVTADTVVNFDELGFDYICIDEAHNFKKVFTAVKSRENEEGEKESRNPYSMSSGEPSGRGLKAFMFCNYLQRRKSGANTCLLTATPFTNSPLEIFSILAMIAHSKLEERGLNSLIDFFDKFINQTDEYVINAKGNWEIRSVIKSFNNKIVLQNIIYSSIIYKTGEEANVPRPIKVEYPLVRDTNGLLLPLEKQVGTQLRPTPTQVYWLKEIYKFANEQSNEIEERLSPDYWKTNPWNPDGDPVILGRVTMAVTLAQICTLSPYLLQIKGKTGAVEKLIQDDGPLTSKKYVETSPKILYTVECLRTIRDWHINRKEEVSGVIIYMNRGTDQFPLVKEYLVNEVGYAESEIQIIIGGITQEKKERIKTAFLSGKVKVIIGSGTIKEGIDLQERTSTLFNLWLDWNPTDLVQLAGRAWRQGNIHSHVRIVTPLVENSMDIFTFQKLEEKTGRINDLWFRAGRSNVLHVEDFDPSELKKGLITDPKQKAEQEINLEVDLIKKEQNLITSNRSLIEESQIKIKLYREKADEMIEYHKKAVEWLKGYAVQMKMVLQDESATKYDKDKAERRIAGIDALLSSEVTDKVLYGTIKRYGKYKMEQASRFGDYYTELMLREVDEQIKLSSEITNVDKNILAPAGLKMGDDLSPLIEKFDFRLEELTTQLTQVQDAKYLADLTAKYAGEMQEAERLSKSTEQRVHEFTRHNYLLSCLKGIDECDLESAMRIVKRGLPEMTVPAKDVPKNHMVYYNGKVVDMGYAGDVKEQFKRASQRISDNLGTGGHTETSGYVRTPSGQFFEVSRSSRIARLVKEENELELVKKKFEISVADTPSTPSIPDKERRIRIAKAKARALQLKLKLAA